MKGFFRQPLVHFLLIGVGLFLLFEWTGGESSDDGTVIVDEDMVRTFVQQRSKAFNDALVDKTIAEYSDDEYDQLIDDLIREEVLYREALALEMEKNDYVIKRRLIQKIEFITNGFVTAATELSDEDGAAYFEAHKKDYYVQPFVTFAHVFFDKERRGADAAKLLAEGKLVEIRREKVLFSDAPKHGDRFLYHVNYVERVPEFVASHFGVSMARAVFELPPSNTQWHGPFESPYGFHLVMVTKNEAGREPELAEVRGRVYEDARQERIRMQSDEAVQKIIDAYDVRVTYERPKARPAASAGGETAPSDKSPL